MSENNRNCERVSDRAQTNGKMGGDASGMPPGRSPRGATPGSDKTETLRVLSSIAIENARVLYSKLPQMDIDRKFIESLAIQPAVSLADGKTAVKRHHECKFESLPLVRAQRATLRRCQSQVTMKLEVAEHNAARAKQALNSCPPTVARKPLYDDHLHEKQSQRLGITERVFFTMGCLFVLVDYISNTTTIEDRFTVAYDNLPLAAALAFIPSLAPLGAAEFFIHTLRREGRVTAIRLMSRISLGFVVAAVVLFMVNLGLAAETPNPMALDGATRPFEVPWAFIQPVMALALIISAVGCFEMSRSNWQARFHVSHDDNPALEKLTRYWEAKQEDVYQLAGELAELASLAKSFEEVKQELLSSADAAFVTQVKKVAAGRSKSDLDNIS